MVLVSSPSHHRPKTVLPPALEWLGAAALLAASILIAYFGISQNGFHFDDWPNILDNPAVRMKELSAAALMDAASNATLPRRPVASISFAIDWWRGGGAPTAFMVTNLLLHIATSWAAFALLRRSIGMAGVATGSVVATLAAASGALWWALQPIHVQAVSYAVQRMTELAALFSLLSVLAYLQARSAPRHAMPWLLACILSFAVAALSKENAWITPLLILMAEYFVIRNDGRLMRTPLDRIIVALPLLAGALVLADIAFHGPLSRWALTGYQARPFTLEERLLTQPKVVLFHISQILWPMPGRFSLEHDVEIVRSATSLHFWLPATIIIAWCAAALAWARQPRRRVVAFWMLWIPVALAIESSFIPLEMVFEHRMYLPSVGIAGLIAHGLVHTLALPRLPAMTAWMAVAVASLLALWATHQRIPQWRTETSLYEQAVTVAPRSARAWNFLGISLLNQRRNERLSAEHYERALQAFTHAIELDARYAPARTNRGVAQWMRGDALNAQADLETAIALSEKEAAAFHYLFEIYQAAGRHEDARRVRHRACFLGVRGDCYR